MPEPSGLLGHFLDLSFVKIAKPKNNWKKDFRKNIFIPNLEKNLRKKQKYVSIGAT